MGEKNHRRGGPGSQPSKRPRFEAIAAAVNHQSPEAGARVVDDSRGEPVIAVRVNASLQAWFRGRAGTWRANIVRTGDGRTVETKNLLYAKGLIAYKEKNPEAVAAAIVSSLDSHRNEIEHYDLLERVAERVNELRPASAAEVVADSPGVFYVVITLDDKHEAQLARDADWGCHLTNGKGVKAEYADRSVALDLRPEESDAGVIAAAFVAAAADFTRA